MHFRNFRKDVFNNGELGKRKDILFSVAMSFDSINSICYSPGTNRHVNDMLHQSHT